MQVEDRKKDHAMKRSRRLPGKEKKTLATPSTKAGEADVWKRTVGFLNKMGPEQENRLTERRRRAAVEGIRRFDAAEGA
eukprot:6064757-Pleurochrysis_carterae.AAC.1